MHPFNLKYLEEISCGDNNFKKELINIFLEQVPEFISNLKKFYSIGDYKNLAKEAHTAKSSVLIFGMEDTGLSLKKIQIYSEKKEMEDVTNLIQKVESDLLNASKGLIEIVKDL